ncbi:MAG TPA: peptide-methionine (R)-S-oxide reductase MsrB [Methanospirillum sp.]|nr:peptide-methionine (R)-S-oxide reductase MsrB [Methanospirillum sp.]
MTDTGDKIPIYNARSGAIDQLTLIVRSNEEWKELLPPDSYEVARLKGTEHAFSGRYYASHDPGMYQCICCRTDLFSSMDKFDSGTGWPSFTRPVSELNIRDVPDSSHGMVRTEVLCARCGAHLGHVFHDGPEPTGMRYCMNSLALLFISKG